MFRRMNSNVQQTMTLFSMCIGRTSVEKSVLELPVSVFSYFCRYVVYCDEKIFTLVKAATALYGIIWLREPEDDGDSVFLDVRNLSPNGTLYSSATPLLDPLISDNTVNSNTRVTGAFMSNIF